MKNNLSYRPFLAALLLPVLLLSITPKRYFHSILAHHIDVKDCPGKIKRNHGVTSIYAAGFNCQTDDLVVESNFIGAAGISELEIIRLYKKNHVEINKFFFSISHHISCLRGPPSNNFC